MSNSDNFDDLVAALQREVIEQAREVYSDKVIEEFYHPKNLGPMHLPDLHASRRGSCGDTMEFFLRLSGERIEEATFVTDGCGATVACGSRLTQMVRGMALGEANRIQPADLVAALDGLPDESLHCADLAVSALRDAIGPGGAVDDVPGNAREPGAPEPARHNAELDSEGGSV